MSRKIEEVQRDYNQAAAELGDLGFKKKLVEENLEKLEYSSQKLINKMGSLAEEARKIKDEASVQAEVALPEEKKDEAQPA